MKYIAKTALVWSEKRKVG